MDLTGAAAVHLLRMLIASGCQANILMGQAVFVLPMVVLVY